MNGLLITFMLGFLISGTVRADCRDGNCSVGDASGTGAETREVAGRESEDAANEPRPYNIPLPGGGFKQATEKEYQQWQAQQQQLLRRQQMQQQVQQQLQNLMGGGGSGGGGGFGGGGGGGGGAGGGGKSSGNSNAIKPLEASAFEQIPNFSSNPAQRALEDLVAQSGKPDSDSQQFLETIKKQIEDSANSPESPQLNQKLTTGISDLNRLIMQTLTAIQALPSTVSGNEKLLKSASFLKKRRTIGRPLDVPLNKGIVVGQSYPSVGMRRALANLAGGTLPKTQEPLLIEAPRRIRSLRPLHHH